MSVTDKIARKSSPDDLKDAEQRHKRPRSSLSIPLVITLVLLTTTIVLGQVSASLSSNQASASRARETLAKGPFAGLPLNPTQIDATRHLITYMDYKQLAKLYVSHMTLDEELGQLFMAEYYDTYYAPELDMMINQLHAGGVVMYAFQMNTFAQTKHDITMMQKSATLPLLISADEEGGFVERVQNIYGHLPGALETYQTGNPNNAARLGHTIAHQLLQLGINTDLAPDVDVQLVDGPDQYLRTWGYTPDSVITYGGAYLRAVQGNGEIACLKHFPGLGAAQTDAHFNLPVINRTKDQIYSTELVPFQHFIQSPNKLDNPGMIMDTDLLMPAIDPVYPAELSPTIITGILRNQFGYDGVVLTDALWMTGIAQKWNLEQAGVLALQAGNDMLLGAIGPYQMQSMIDAIKAALQDGSLTMARINQAVTRIIALKMQYHLIP